MSGLVSSPVPLLQATLARLSPAALSARLPANGRLPRKRWNERLQLLDEAAGPLREFSRLTDHEFAALAQRLGDYQKTCGLLRDATHTLEALFRSEDDENALRRAIHLGKHAVELVHSTIGIGFALRSNFGQVRRELENALAARDEFDGHMVIFRSLSIGFRIEAARCEEAYRGIFSAVAEDFSNLEKQVSRTSASTFAKIESLVAATSAQTGEDQGERGYEKELARVQHMRTSIDQMESALDPCARQVREATDLLDQIPDHMTTVVRNLQYQDIVRQKIEHVSEGLEVLHEPRNRSAQLFAHIARLQLAQLHDAKQQINGAGSEVINGVTIIGRLGQSTSESVARLEKAALEDLGTRQFGKNFADDLNQLTQVAQTAEAAQQRISSHVEEIEAVIELFTQEIAHQQQSVRLAALNAQIAAARLTNGGALEKLAQETSRVAKANESASETLRQRLMGTRSMLNGVRQEAAESLDLLAREKVTLETGAATIADEIDTFASRIESDAHRIAEAFSTSQQALDELCRGITFPNHLERSFQPLDLALADFAAPAAGLPPEEALESCPHAAALLAEHSARYTMKEERQTHEAILAAPVANPIPSAETPLSTALEEEEEDGIELF